MRSKTKGFETEPEWVTAVQASYAQSSTACEDKARMRLLITKARMGETSIETELRMRDLAEILRTQGKHYESSGLILRSLEIMRHHKECGTMA